MVIKGQCFQCKLYNGSICKNDANKIVLPLKDGIFIVSSYYEYLHHS